MSTISPKLITLLLLFRSITLKLITPFSPFSGRWVQNLSFVTSWPFRSVSPKLTNHHPLCDFAPGEWSPACFAPLTEEKMPPFSYSFLLALLLASLAVGKDTPFLAYYPSSKKIVPLLFHCSSHLLTSSDKDKLSFISFGLAALTTRLTPIITV